MGWFIQTAIFVIFNKVCTSQVRPTLYLFVTWIDEYDVDLPNPVFSLVYVVLTSDYPSSIYVMVLVCQISHVLDRDTGIVAQPGVPSGISGGTYFFPPVDL
jgi:hypothetical protein